MNSKLICVNENTVTKYKNDLICNKCHIILPKNINSFRQQTCLSCIDIEKLIILKNILELNGYTLINEIYDGKHTTFLCKEHGLITTSTPNITKCCFCKKCGTTRTITHTLDTIIYRVEVEYAHLNLSVIATEYKNIKTPLHVECLLCNHQFYYHLAHLSRGDTCKKCNTDNKSESIKIPFNIMKERISKYNYTLLEIIYGEHIYTVFKIRCSQNHISKRHYGEITRGAKCPECISARTLTETVCRKYIEYLFDLPFRKVMPDWLINEEGNKIELDGYNEQLGVAFEADGKQHTHFIEYFHKTVENFEKRQQMDFIKDKLCKERGIILIRIPYTVKYDQILGFIKQKCLIYNVSFEDKPDISVVDLDVFNKTIEDRNKLVDEKLNNTIWSRINSVVSSSEKVQIQCNTCDTIRNIAHSNLMGRKLPKCEPCFKNNQEQIIQDVIIKNNWNLIGKYTTSKSSLQIECTKCKHQDVLIPKNILYDKTFTRVCPNCVLLS